MHAALSITEYGAYGEQQEAKQADPATDIP
jgi:hypothetical protein